MDVLLNNLLITFILVLMATFLIKYAANKKFNVNNSVHNGIGIKTGSFKIAIQGKGKNCNAIMTILEEKISIRGDMCTDIPLEKIACIDFPYALNTVSYRKNRILHNQTVNFNIPPDKLMSSLFIVFYDDKNELLTLNIVMLESERNFKVNKIARVRFVRVIQSIRGRFSVL